MKNLRPVLGEGEGGDELAGESGDCRWRQASQGACNGLIVEVWVACDIVTNFDAATEAEEGVEGKPRQ